MGNKRIIIVAASASEPGQMGGNTKITIEMARNLPKLDWTVEVIVPAEKKPTFTDNIGEVEGVTYHTYPRFPGSEFKKALSSPVYHYKMFKAAFEELGASKGDIVYLNCNFHYEIVPLVLLKRKFGFIYLPSHYLFSPFILENLARHYRLPALKWLIVWFYERFFFRMSRLAADGFVITNDSDRVNFPGKFQDRLIAIYGGVNVEQIPDAAAGKIRDVVFCSRLHPQKGVEGLLDIWALAVKELPQARLSIIGNGAPGYEKRLRDRADRLGISGNIEWLGYVNNEAKYRIYRETKVFVHSTVFDNNGMVAAEALCSGLPVVMYDLPALRKVYTAGCVKVPYSDKAAFAKAIVDLLKSPRRLAEVSPDGKTVESLRSYWRWTNRAELMSAYLEHLYG